MEYNNHGRLVVTAVPSSSSHHHHHQDPNSTQTTASSNSYSSSSSSSYPATQKQRQQAVKLLAKIKICCVGDGGVGKTCLLISYAENRFPTGYTPTVFENYVTRVPYGDNHNGNSPKIVEMSLWDTAGQEEFDRLRPLSYPESDVVIICFAVNYPPSLSNVEDKWSPEVAHFCEGVPILLIGTKTDLRTDRHQLDLLSAQGTQPISHAEGEAAAKRIGAKYAECSAREGRGVQEIFELALREAMKRKGASGGGSALRFKKKGCAIL